VTDPKFSQRGWLDRSIVIFLIMAIAVGIGFRLTSLDRKLYWHDEVYTSFRAAGYTGAEISQEIFSDRLLLPSDLLKFQQFKPDSTPWDTIDSLAIEDPQHPPLYYLISRLWMQLFGSAIPIMRLLPALISLLALPFMYGLAFELFGSHLIALLATAFLALSPFDILFAQIARQYSLLTVSTIASSFYLLRAIGSRSTSSWMIYSLASAIGLYTHPFFGFTLIGHGVTIIVDRFILTKRKTQDDVIPDPPLLIPFLGSIVGALMLYSPWLIVIGGNYKRALSSTSWAAVGTDWFMAAKLWLLSFTSLFLDLDFGFDNFWTFGARLPIFLLVVMGIYAICRRTRPLVWVFVLSSILVPFLMLFLPDLFLGGRRSTVSRYLIGCYPGIQLSIAYLIGIHLGNLDRSWQLVWKSVLVTLFACSIASCTVSAISNTWWSNVPSYFNAETARIINSKPNAVMIADEGNGTNLGDVISLAHLLRPEVKLLLLKPQIPDSIVQSFADQFVFRPSGKIRQAILARQLNLEVVDGTGGDLWRIGKS